MPTEGLTEGQEVTGEPVAEPIGDKGKQIKSKGYQTRPHVLLSSGGLNGYYGLLNNYWPDKKLVQRVYPPASKLSIGHKSAQNVKISRAFSLACQVATLTPAKAARQVGRGERAAVIPDLPIGPLVTYLRLLRFIQSKDTAPFAGRAMDEESVYLLANDGNFPAAPPGWTFGALGVVAAIGSWARANRSMDRARPVLDALADERVYVVGTDGTTVTEPVGQHVTRLATEDDLANALEDTWKVQTEAEEEELQRFFRRWLLLYTEGSFQDFLSMRATYPPSFAYIFHDYFMTQHDPELIASAKAAGQHISNQAWHAADGATDDQKRANKETILAGLESMLFDCSDGAELVGRLSVQVGRLTGSSFPEEAQLFFDRTASGELDMDTARNLVTAYTRLRQSGSDQSENDLSESESDKDASGGGQEAAASALEDL